MNDYSANRPGSISHTSEVPLVWRFDGGLMVAHYMLTGNNVYEDRENSSGLISFRSNNASSEGSCSAH